MQFTHIKRVCKDFERKYLCKYYDFYVQSNTLLPAVVFENFQDMCPKIYELNPACTRISMVSSFNKKQSKTISVVSNWYWCVINGMWKITTNTWKIMIKTKNYYILSIGMEIICMDR